MAEFLGYLLKIDGKILPNSYITEYAITPDQIQDKDSYQDVEGCLHRDILPHSRSKIEFQTPPLSLTEKMDFQSYFPDRKANPEINIEYWNDMRNEYVNGVFYVPDIQFKLQNVMGVLWYKPFRVALIEY